MLERFTILDDRAVVSVSGEGAADFLQGLISNDITKVTAQHVIHAFLLTPQGKYLHDFFVLLGPDGAYWLETHKDQADALVRRLSVYKLRAKVAIERLPQKFVCFAIFSDDGRLLFEKKEPGARVDLAPTMPSYIDPRLQHLGARVLAPEDLQSLAETQLAERRYAFVDRLEYETFRIRQAVPDCMQDLKPEFSTLMESNADLLNGISWDKGCYVGQELTARMRYRGILKRRLFPVTGDTPENLPEAGTPLILEGKAAGELRGSAGNMGLGLIKIEAAQKILEAHKPLTAGDRHLDLAMPDWLLQAVFQSP